MRMIRAKAPVQLKFLGTKNLCRQAQIGDQTHTTLSFGPKPSLASCSTTLYFFCAWFQVLSRVPVKLGVLVPSFNDFTDNSNSSMILNTYPLTLFNFCETLHFFPFIDNIHVVVVKPLSFKCCPFKITSN